MRDRLEFWQQVLLPKWQFSFSQLLTEKRFAVLGLALVASLAETCHITGITSDLPRLEQTGDHRTLEGLLKKGERPSDLEKDGFREHEDLGEVVVRSEPKTTTADAGPLNEASKHQPQGSGLQSTTAVARPTRKKRRKGNAIDDLFSGLD